MLDRFPKPVIVGVAVVVVILCLVIIFKTTVGGGENANRPTRQEIMGMQRKAGGAQGAHSQNAPH